MKEVTYYSDVTGEEIEDHWTMVAVTVKYSQSWQKPRNDSEGTVHLGDDFEIDHDRAENGFTAYLQIDEQVAMITENTGSQVLHYGRDTDDDTIQRLMACVELAVSDNERRSEE